MLDVFSDGSLFGIGCGKGDRTVVLDHWAIAEFTELSAEAPLYASISDLLANYRAILEARGQLTPEDEELIMNLSTAYLKKQEE
jgi:hypothetical protein